MAVNSILLDTNAYTAFKYGNREIVSIFERVSKLFLCTIVLGELRDGFAFSQRKTTHINELQLFLNLPQVSLLRIDRLTAEQYTTVYRKLRRAALPFPTNDMWIAAVALQHNIPLLTTDQHFRAISGLQVISSAADLHGTSNQRISA